jgi:hypothetical protein
LNNETVAVKRSRLLGPYFHGNDVYPIFFTWKTGFVETFAGIIVDHLARLVPKETFRGLWGDLKQATQDAKDRLIESACQELHIKAIWSQMKQNAQAAATEPKPTLGLTARHLATLKKRVPALELHLVGHSAGAILLGHLLDALADPTWAGPNGLPISSCTLYAPACTVEFALRHYARALGGVLPRSGAVTVEVLSDERERADSVGPYGKSLLYLVSRGLESHHKTPILGLEKVWGKAPADWGNASLAQQAADWRRTWQSPALVAGDNGDASDGTRALPWCHGTFDNDVGVITRTLERIRGKKLVAPVESLSGY